VQLVGGDVSGIQNFIYNLTSKGALKGLRGRSLYLQLLPEAIAARILDEFSLTRANLLYCGGGHFYVLLPARGDTNRRLDEVTIRVARTLLAVHGGRLSVGVAARPLVPADFGRTEFGAAWDALHQELAREKRRRFGGLMTNENGIHDVLGPHGSGGEEACIVCGEEMKSSRDGKCDACGSFEKLAGRLTDARVIIESVPSSPPETPSTWQEALSAIGREYTTLPQPAPEGLNLLINSTDFVPEGFAGFRFLAKHVPRKEGTESAAELGDIAGHSNGINRWGVLRADVDNLGRALAEGLGENRSISRLSMLSHLLGYFFSARVQALAEDAEFRDKVYLVYSGGDDLFAIGAWSVLPNFARRTYDAFRTFTSERLTLSAGIFVAPSDKFPVYEAADLAGEAEEAAKADPDKDSLNFLGSTVRWSNLPEAQDIKTRLVELTKIGGLPKSILSTLNASWEQRRQARNGTIPMFPIWRLYYAFKRLKDRHKDLARQIDELEHNLVQKNDLHPQLDLIIRWAEFETRTNKESR